MISGDHGPAPHQTHHHHHHLHHDTSALRKRKRLSQVVLELTTQAERRSPEEQQQQQPAQQQPPQDKPPDPPKASDAAASSAAPAKSPAPDTCEPAQPEKKPMFSRQPEDALQGLGDVTEGGHSPGTGLSPRLTVQEENQEEAMKVDTPPSPKDGPPGELIPASAIKTGERSPSVIQVHRSGDLSRSPHRSNVFSFDSVDRERYLCRAISEEDEDVFSPGPSLSRSPHARDSPLTRVNTDSPKLSFSPLRIKDPSIDEEDIDFDTKPPSSASSFGSIDPPASAGVIRTLPKLSVMRSEGGLEGCAAPHYPNCSCPRCSVGVRDSQRLGPSSAAMPHSPISPLTPSTPHTPNTPISPSPGHNVEHYFSNTMYLPELSRRRSHSDSDLQLWFDHKVRSSEASAASSSSGGTSTIAGGGSTRSTSGETTSSTRNSIFRMGRPIPQPLYIPRKGGSLESDNSSPQDSPLDLSVKTGSSLKTGSTSSASTESLVLPGTISLSSPHSPLLGVTISKDTPSPRSPGAPESRSIITTSSSHLPVPIVKGDVASHTTKESVAQRYNLEVSPVVEEMPAGADVAFVCPICGQMFSLHDRLAKHMASRHKSKQTEPSNRTYMCDVCKRSFARSDMLTRHMRLHTGIKPYTCRVCGQVFSRSDHLSTHQRTHTGEKPYKCPQCPYAACRRDMITRHMRTHARYELHESSSMDEAGDTARPSLPQRSLSEEHPPPSPLHEMQLSGSGGGRSPAPPPPSSSSPGGQQVMSKSSQGSGGSLLSLGVPGGMSTMQPIPGGGVLSHLPPSSHPPRRKEED
ncbi:zinc finger protein klumpfuss [Oratosquilla oratoria]|uniref:zinc finger protein klumpfuss n=1 Tax=Oratosquilla oratoria TaxID=337810 RepID=UPI003F776137